MQYSVQIQKSKIIINTPICLGGLSWNFFKNGTFWYRCEVWVSTKGTIEYVFCIDKNSMKLSKIINLYLSETE